MLYKLLFFYVKERDVALESSEHSTVADNTAADNRNHETEEKSCNSALDEWTLEDKDTLFQFVTRVFLNNFPLYRASKCLLQTPLEELSKQELALLTSYCELTVMLSNRLVFSRCYAIFSAL